MTNRRISNFAPKNLNHIKSAWNLEDLTYNLKSSLNQELCGNSNEVNAFLLLCQEIQELKSKLEKVHKEINEITL